GVRVCRDGVEHLLHLDRLHLVILIHHAQAQAAHHTAKRVAEHEQLDERHHHRHNHQCGTAPEPAKVALDNGPDAIHWRCVTKPKSVTTEACSESRNCRPV